MLDNINIFNLEGQIVGQTNLPQEIFAKEFNKDLLKQVVEMQDSNLRKGNASTKSRSELAYSTKKERQQKGSGRARMGPFGAPHHVGGSVAFGPNSRSYSCKIQKKKMSLAICVGLSKKLIDKDLIIVDAMQMKEIKTKLAVNMMNKLNLNLVRRVLFIDSVKNDNFFLSMRNIVGCDFLPSYGINPRSIVRSHKIVMSLDSIKDLEKRYVTK